MKFRLVISIKKYETRKRSYKFNLIFVEKSLLKRKEKEKKPIKSRAKKDASKVTDEKFPVSDSCKSAVDVIYLTCTLCTKVYHFSCAHPLSNFGDNVPSLIYVSPGCVHNNNTSFHHFSSRAATHKVTFEDSFIRDQFELLNNLKSYNKIDIRYLSFPRAHHYRILPRAEDIVVKSKSGIWNVFNNCYLSIIVHMLLGTVSQHFLHFSFENPNEIVSTLHSCRKKISSSEEEAVNLTREFKFFTEKILSEDLERKKCHDAVEFLDCLIDKLLSESCFLEEQFIFFIFNMITCLNSKSTFGEVVQQQKSITIPIPDQENSLTLKSLLCFRFFCDVREPDLRTSCSEGCTGRVHETTILRTALKLLIINTSQNTTSTNFCQKLVEIPSSLYLDGFLGDSYGSINYTLISVVYR